MDSTAMELVDRYAVAGRIQAHSASVSRFGMARIYKKVLRIEKLKCWQSARDGGYGQPSADHAAQVRRNGRN